ncbi:MAG: adenylate/guanylate cyclase domain-containing protein [Elusimicrobiota bacterium]|jgi:adenylate cyclase
MAVRARIIRNIEQLRRRRALFFRAAQYAVPGLLLFVSLWARVGDLGLVERIQHKAFDVLQELRPRVYEDAPVLIADIDDESLARLGQWPWPRTQVARLIDRLDALGASSIAFDVIFAEPDRTSPSRILSVWPDAPELRSLRAAIGRLPDNDVVLGRAFASSRVVTGFALSSESNAAVPAVKAAFAHAGDSPLSFIDDYPGAVTALPVLEKPAAGNGGISFVPERDGIIRRAPLIFRRGKTLLPSLSAEALRVAQGVPNYAVKSSNASGEAAFGARTGISKVKIGSLVLPTDGKGRLWVYYTRRDPRRTLPVWKLFEKGFDPERVKGRIVFVGTSAAGLKDLRATPLDPAAPGVEVHANAAEQALLGVFLHRPDWAAGAEILYMLALGLLLLLLLPRLGAGWCAPLGFGGVLAACAISWRAFTVHRYLIDPVFPALTVLLVYMSSSLVSYLRSESERTQVKGAFSRYMSPALVEQLARHPEKLKLGGELREMTLLFCDIRGFTTISEQFDPHGLTHFINRFLTPMTELILERQGTIDKYMGDCIMAFWNAPLDDAEHARNACRSALAMHARLKELNAEWEAEAKAENRRFIPVRIGIGLNTGPCCVGNMGSDQRFDYSVLGDDVNLASRLEGQSKTYGADTVIGPRTRECAPEYAALELDLIKVKGKTVPVRIHALLGGEELRADPAFRALEEKHGRMLAAYRSKDWDAAEALLEECRTAPFALKTLYDLYAGRIDVYRETPPPLDWDGSFAATSK